MDNQFATNINALDYTKFTTDDLVKLNKIHKKKKILNQDIRDLEKEYRAITEEMKTHGCVIDGRIEDPKTRNMRIGRRKFNSNPDEGINYLVSKGILTKTPSAIAKFLFDDRLNKKAIGDYIGNVSNSFNIEVLESYVRQYDFSGLEFVESIRLFLSGFHLPGESQKIDKIINIWSNLYNEQNSGYFKSEKESYIMSYAIIMLNTCLHNPTAKKYNGGFGREEDFIKIMQGCEISFDLSFVKKIFQNIKRDPLSCMHRKKEDSPAFLLENVEISGWLWKLGGRVKNWKKRWFVLTDDNLMYFVHPESSEMKGLISLDNIFVRMAPGDRNYSYCFELVSNDLSKMKGCKNNSSGKKVLGHHFSYKMCSLSDLDLKNWTDAIQRCINMLWQRRLLQEFE